jgi:hypothetical protein
MSLVLLIAALLVLGLGLVQAWTIWFLKREVQRLEFRLGEALDDEDLLEFQERLRGLLAEAKAAAEALAEAVDRRKEAFDLSLEKAKQAEKSLALRILAKTASEAVAAQAKAGPKPAAKSAPAVEAVAAKVKAASKPEAAATKPSAKPAPRAKPVPARGAASRAPIKLKPASSDPQEPKDGADLDGHRSYLVRPEAPTARYQKIYELADQGLGLEQIAKQSGLLAGEVDLILNLRPKKP